MNALNRLDSFHLRAAKGWMELGNPYEAGEELRRIGPEGDRSPEVRTCRWETSAVANNWEAALLVADSLIFWAVEDPQNWRRRAFSLHQLGITESARDCLITALAKFPRNPEIHYDLAVYECQTGRLLRAMVCLAKAFAIGDAKSMTIAALADPSLQPLWRRISPTQAPHYTQTGPSTPQTHSGSVLPRSLSLSRPTSRRKPKL